APPGAPRCPYTTRFRSKSSARHRQLGMAGVAVLAAALSGVWMWTISVSSNAGLPSQVERVAGTTSAQEAPEVPALPLPIVTPPRSEEHTSELQSRGHLV